MARYIGKRRTKEINIIGAIQPASRAVDWGLWNRVVPNDDLQAEVTSLLEVLRAKNQQACRQLKLIINRGCEIFAEPDNDWTSKIPLSACWTESVQQDGPQGMSSRMSLD